MKPTIATLSAAAKRHPYLASALMIAAVTGFGFAAGPVLHSPNLDILYLLAVFVTALQWGRRPALFCALASVMVFDFCFIPPYFSFAITDLPYLVSLAGFVAVALITSELASRARDAILAQSARAKAEADRAQLEAVNRAKDSVLSRVAHELRSPITAILGRVHLLEQASDPERVMRSLPALERSARILARLSQDLLESSRGAAGKLHVSLQPTLLSPIVSDAVENALLSAADKHISVHAVIDPMPLTLADPDRIEQMVTNLMSNAIKFTPVGGRIDVSLKVSRGLIELVVSDSGPGIPTDFLPRLFEPFSQAANGRAHEGLGLGLSIVKNLVAAHNGDIVARSAGSGRGATFTIYLPIVAAALHANANVPPIEHYSHDEPARDVRYGEQQRR